MDEKELDMAERVWEQLCTKPGQRTDYISDLIAQAREAVRLREAITRSLDDCIPAPSDNNGASDLHVGFRRGWNAARSFTMTQADKGRAALGSKP